MGVPPIPQANIVGALLGLGCESKVFGAWPLPKVLGVTGYHPPNKTCFSHFWLTILRFWGNHHFQTKHFGAL